MRSEQVAVHSYRCAWRERKRHWTEESERPQEQPHTLRIYTTTISTRRRTKTNREEREKRQQQLQQPTPTHAIGVFGEPATFALRRQLAVVPHHSKATDVCASQPTKVSIESIQQRNKTTLANSNS
ncbi:uncharacterized protein LOC116805567 [Drosophila grimshawi]|uniref:uncharacterized protein LOC116805567 n=1 Tax=Drosophila grimshawi TaxID=7222 RepID=UPI0013EEF598|nr:uncharacterized protein LOC116805567 [Drosophila grimshawi]